MRASRGAVPPPCLSLEPKCLHRWVIDCYFLKPTSFTSVIMLKFYLGRLLWPHSIPKQLPIFTFYNVTKGSQQLGPFRAPFLLSLYFVASHFGRVPRTLSILCIPSSIIHHPHYPGAGSDEDGIKLITAFRKTTGKNSAFQTPGGRSPVHPYGRMTSLACCPFPTVHNRVTVAFSMVAQQPRKGERWREHDRRTGWVIEKERRKKRDASNFKT